MFPIDISMGTFQLISYLLLVTLIIVSLKNIINSDGGKWDPLWGLSILIGGPFFIGWTVVIIAERWSSIISFITKFIRIV